MQERVYKTLVSKLKQHLIDSWSSLSQDVIDDTVDQCQLRLRACVKAKGRYFEHLLQTGSSQRQPRFPEETCTRYFRYAV